MKSSVISWKSFLGIVTITVLLSCPAMAQLDRATLTGTITDPADLPLAGARVSIVHKGTGLEREAVVPESGAYTFPALPIGHYQVTIAATGFKSVRFEDIELQVGTVRTLNARLEIASDAVEVEVRGEMEQLQRTSAEIGNVIQDNQIASLPVNGRHWAGLMLLTPGAINTGSGSQDSTRFIGRANDDNNWTLDGVDNTAIKDPTYGSNIRLVVSMDSIAEFKVSSSLYSAESGGGMGGQVHLVSKSGTNDFHGGLFEYVRNDIFDARTVFDGPELPPFRLNQFGGNIGGPIVKNKAFFFFNYEGLRQRKGSTYISQVPSSLLRSEVMTVSPELKPLVDKYPAGIRPTNDPYVDDFVADFSNTSDEDSMTARIDFNISEKTTLYGRWNFNDHYSTSPSGLRKEWYDGESQRPQNFALQLQRTFSPSLLNEVKLGINRVPRKEGNFGAFEAMEFGIPGLTSVPRNEHQYEIGTTAALIDNLSLYRGRHSFKFGVEVRKIWMNVGWSPSRSVGFEDMEAFINNQVEGIDIDGGMPMVGGRRTYYFAYAQDEWKLRPNFTLSLGARYEYYTVIREEHDRLLVFDTSIGDFAPQGTPAYQPDRNNIAPRLSFAWSPTAFKDKTVIRGGYGMYYGPGQVDDVMAGIETYEESFALDSADVPNLSFPVEPFLDQAVSEGRTPRHLLPWREDMYSQHWGLSIQQQLPAEFVAQVSYNGGNAHKILSRTYINNINPATGKRPWPKFGKIDSKESAGNGSFNSLQVSLKRRLSGGLQLGGEYMWSHSLNDGMIGGGESTAPQNVLDRRAGKANSNYDIRQTATTNFLWELPFGPGRRFLTSGVAGAILGGWDLSGIWAARTGRMLSVSVSRSSKDLPDGNSSNQRPDLVPNVPLYPEEQTISNWMNRSAYAVPAKGKWGNLGRNTLTGPGVNQWDIALLKTVPINERHKISFRAEFFNFFNRPHLGNPGTNISSSSFGRITSPMNRDIGTGTPRQIQFMLRWAF
ncbi:MAG: TonB-dependent receptor domain-containing protein [Acidobacteriota bacterium]